MSDPASGGEMKQTSLLFTYTDQPGYPVLPPPNPCAGKAEGTGLPATEAQRDGIAECVPASDTAPGLRPSLTAWGAQDETRKIMGEKGRTSRGP